jgi:hypothetical protein
VALRPREGAAAGPPGCSAERRRFGWPDSPSPAPPAGVEVHKGTGGRPDGKRKQEPRRRWIDDWAWRRCGRGPAQETARPQRLGDLGQPSAHRSAVALAPPLGLGRHSAFCFLFSRHSPTSFPSLPLPQSTPFPLPHACAARLHPKQASSRSHLCQVFVRAQHSLIPSVSPLPLRCSRPPVCRRAGGTV